MLASRQAAIFSALSGQLPKINLEVKLSNKLFFASGELNKSPTGLPELSSAATSLKSEENNDDVPSGGLNAVSLVVFSSNANVLSTIRSDSPFWLSSTLPVKKPCTRRMIDLIVAVNELYQGSVAAV